MRERERERDGERMRMRERVMGDVPGNQVQAQDLPPQVIAGPSTQVRKRRRLELQELAGRGMSRRRLAHAGKSRRRRIDHGIFGGLQRRSRPKLGVHAVEKEMIEYLEHHVHCSGMHRQGGLVAIRSRGEEFRRDDSRQESFSSRRAQSDAVSDSVKYTSGVRNAGFDQTRKTLGRLYN